MWAGGEDRSLHRVDSSQAHCDDHLYHGEDKYIYLAMPDVSLDKEYIPYNKEYLIYYSTAFVDSLAYVHAYLGTVS